MCSSSNKEQNLTLTVTFGIKNLESGSRFRSFFEGVKMLARSYVRVCKNLKGKCAVIFDIKLKSKLDMMGFTIAKLVFAVAMLVM